MINGVDVLGTILLITVGFFMGCLAMRILWLMKEEGEQENESTSD